MIRGLIEKSTIFSNYLFSGRGNEQEERQEERRELQKLDTG